MRLDMFVFHDCRFAVILDVPSLLLWSCFAANCQMKNMKRFFTISLLSSWTHFLMPCKWCKVGIPDLCQAVADYILYIYSLFQVRRYLEMLLKFLINWYFFPSGNSKQNTLFSYLQGMQQLAALNTHSLDAFKNSLPANRVSGSRAHSLLLLFTCFHLI